MLRIRQFLPLMPSDLGQSILTLKDCEAAKGNIKGGFLSGQKQTKATSICFCKNANTAHITEIGGTFIVILVS